MNSAERTCLVMVIVLASVCTCAAGQEALPPVVIYSKASPPPTPKLESLALTDTVSQYGITWTFSEKVRVGRFVSGDWYVVGPAAVKMIDPKPLWGDEVKETINKDSVEENRYPGKQARNGSSLNPPSKAKKCGFDSRVPSSRYDPALFAHLPISMKPGDALVSTVSRRNDEITKFGGQHVDPLRVAAVLTCVVGPQPPDAFRPSYCDSAHSRIFLARNLRRDLLLALPRPAGAPANLDTYARAFQKPWLDVADFGFAAPVENLPHYGQQMVERTGEGSLLLLCDYPAQEKERVLVGLVQVGIDLFGVARGGFVWQAHGGLNSGRKWPIVLAGILLDDKDMQSPAHSVPGSRFGEDDQTALGPVTYKGKTFERSWTGARAIFLGHSPYLMNRANHWEDGWGPVDLFPPSEWPPRSEAGKLPASEGYRRANTSGAWVAEALAARLMHAEKVWDHDAFFAYVDRWMAEDDTAAVRAIKDAKLQDMTGVKRGDFSRQGYVSAARWVSEMWQKCRNNLPPAPDGHKEPKAEETWK